MLMRCEIKPFTSPWLASDIKLNTKIQTIDISYIISGAIYYDKILCIYTFSSTFRWTSLSRNLDHTLFYEHNRFFLHISKHARSKLIDWFVNFVSVDLFFAKKNRAHNGRIRWWWWPSTYFDVQLYNGTESLHKAFFKY